MDGSDNIPIVMSHRRWIRLSRIVNPFILNILSVYSIRLQVVIPWNPQAVMKHGPHVLSFYIYLLQGACIAGHPDSDCLHLRGITLSTLSGVLRQSKIPKKHLTSHMNAT